MRKSKNLTIIITFALLLMTAACKIKRPDNIIPEEKMEKILLDYHMAKAVSNNIGYDDAYKKEAYKNYVLKKYEISESDFDSSFAWYARNTKIFEKIYQNIEKNISSRLETVDNVLRLRENKFIKALSGDSLNVWGASEDYYLTSMPNNSLLMFSEDIDTTFHLNDNLKFKANYNFLKGNARQKAIATVSILYEKDSIANFSKEITENGYDSIMLNTSAKKEMEKIYLSIYFASSYKETGDSTMLHIKDLEFMRYHEAKPQKKNQ